MSYLIDGRPLTKRTRPELLTLCKRLYEQRESAQTSRSRAINDFRIASGLRDMAEAQRDQALHECKVLRGERDSLTHDLAKRVMAHENVYEAWKVVVTNRDSYKKESTDNWLKLTAAESALSAEQARVVVLRGQVTAARRLLGLIAVAGVCTLAVMLFTACDQPTAVQSPTDCGKEQVWSDSAKGWVWVPLTCEQKEATHD